MTVLRIRDWEKHFENNRTSEIRKLTWVPFPNKHDGEGYSILVTGHENGAAHYGAWCVIVQIASKCSPRGTLIRDDGTPHTPQSLAAKSRLPAAILQEAAARLLEIKWLEAIELPDNDLQKTPQDAAAAPQDGAARARARNRTEGKGTEGKGTEGKGTEQKKGGTSILPLWTCPESLNTERFKTAFDTFLKHRQQKRSPMTAIAIAGALSKMEKLGETRAVAAIEHSIAAGYTGIFEPSDGNNGGRHGNDADRRRAEKRSREFDEPEIIPIIRPGKASRR